MTLTNTTGTGHLLYLQSANLTASSYISSVSGGGTWVVPSQCQINLSGQGPLSCAYVLTSSSTSSITVTMGSSSVNGFLFSEVSRTSGSFALDAINCTQNSASFYPSGQALTLSGTDDVIFQTIFVPGGGGAAGPTLYPYYWSNGGFGGPENGFLAGEANAAILLDTANGAAPVWLNNQNNATTVCGVAFN